MACTQHVLSTVSDMCMCMPFAILTIDWPCNQYRYLLSTYLRLARRAAAHAAPDGGVSSGTQPLAPLARDAIMARFLPERLSAAVDGWLQTAGASDPVGGGGGGGGGVPRGVRCAVEGGSSSGGGLVVSGASRVAVRAISRPELVPSPRVFFDSDVSSSYM